MYRARAERIETVVDAGAGSTLGAAAAFALAQSGIAMVVALAGGVAAAMAGFAALRLVKAEEPAFDIAQFRLPDLEPQIGLPDELLLEDVLAPADPDARVVRLFDASAMPTPGEPHARIAQHFGNAKAPPPDASQALFEALAELKGSLR